MVRAQGDQVGSSDRVAALQGDCLIRDRHRCVISRTFHAPEALSRYEADGQDLRDDDGQLLANGACQFEDLRVAHILPQSLTETGPDSTELVLSLRPLQRTKERQKLMMSRVLKKRPPWQFSTCWTMASWS